jgi:two-component system OmpR family response regulator
MADHPKVLVVDDEAHIRETLAKALRFRGVEAKALDGGEAVLEALRAEAYDVVVMDVKMPGMDGVEILRRLKAQGCRAEVIILTGYVSSDAAVELIRLGACDYLIKPCDFDELYDKISLAYDRKMVRDITPAS